MSLNLVTSSARLSRAVVTLVTSAKRCQLHVQVHFEGRTDACIKDTVNYSKLKKNNNRLKRHFSEHKQKYKKNYTFIIKEKINWNHFCILTKLLKMNQKRKIF